MLKLKNLLVLVFLFSSVSVYGAVDGNAEVNCNLHNPSVKEQVEAEGHLIHVFNNAPAEVEEQQSKTIRGG